MDFMNKKEKISKEKNAGSCRIADAANTYDSALMTIKAKGFKIFLYPDERESYLGNFYAIKGQRVFSGSDPLRLLGIISLWETLGDNWQTQNKIVYENLYDEILDKAFPESVADFEKLTDKEFRNLVFDYQIFFGQIGLVHKLPINITRQDFFDLLDNFYKEDYYEANYKAT
jgi:hypothetical protein